MQREWYESAPGAAHFEDGTVNFLNLPAVEVGLRFLDGIGIETIHARVQALAARLLERLDSLRHSNDAPAATIYGPRDLDERGATVAFNFLHPDGRVVDERYVDRIARQHNISLRTGCFCNPGAGEVAFTISRETLVGGEFGQGMTLDDYIHMIGLPSGGVVRSLLSLIWFRLVRWSLETALVLCLLGLGVGAFGTLMGAGGGFILTPTLLLLYPHGSRLRLALVHAAPFGASPIAHIAEG